MPLVCGCPGATCDGHSVELAVVLIEHATFLRLRELVVDASYLLQGGEADAAVRAWRTKAADTLTALTRQTGERA